MALPSAPFCPLNGRSSATRTLPVADVEGGGVAGLGATGAGGATAVPGGGVVRVGAPTCDGEDRLGMVVLQADSAMAERTSDAATKRRRRQAKRRADGRNTRNLRADHRRRRRA